MPRFVRSTAGSSLGQILQTAAATAKFASILVALATLPSGVVEQIRDLVVRIAI